MHWGGAAKVCPMFLKIGAPNHLAKSLDLPPQNGQCPNELLYFLIGASLILRTKGRHWQHHPNAWGFWIFFKAVFYFFHLWSTPILTKPKGKTTPWININESSFGLTLTGTNWTNPTFGYFEVLLGTWKFFFVPWGSFGYFEVLLGTFRYFWALWGTFEYIEVLLGTLRYF